MRYNSSHFFYQVDTVQIHHQLALGSPRWFTVMMAWVMVVSSMAIAWNSWSKATEQRVARHFAVFLMRFLSARKWHRGTLLMTNHFVALCNNPTKWPWTYIGIIDARGMLAAIPAGQGFGLDDLHSVELFGEVPGKGLVARALALAS
jgi:hypothetical protein